MPATTDSKHRWRVWPNLARWLEPMAMNQLWVADITYVRLFEAFAYLAVILDAFSRRVVGWALAEHLQASLALAALDMALNTRGWCPVNWFTILIRASSMPVATTSLASKPTASSRA